MDVRNCEGCGNTFEPKTKRMRRCHKDCGRKRSSKSANSARSAKRELKTFIGVDGEGVTREDGTHDYVLLSVGSRSLYRADGAHLHWRDIFPFLYDCFLDDPNAAYVGFYLGYDFTQWFKTISEDRARALLSKEGIANRSRKRSGGNPVPFPVHLGEWEWEIDILGMKRFMLRPGTGFPPNLGVKNTNAWMVICDCGSFFQMSFLKVIGGEVGHILTQEEYDVIQEGKERRSDATFNESMVRYNTLENGLLSRVMAQLNNGFKSVGIALTRRQWFGPGQAAQAWMDLIKAPLGNDVRDAIPEYARDIARQTYYGGWFEIFRHGTIPGTSWEYDINSAYPYIISRLPCLLHGKWSMGTRPPTLPVGSIRMVHGIATGSNLHVGTLLHRTERGSVMRPSKTSGWYWEHEVEAAKAAGIIDTFETDEYVQYDPCDCSPPFAAIADLYQLRLRVGKKTPQGKAYKLIYNSSYGKMAQSVGNPKFSNAVYASLITAGCRTMILQAIATHPTKTRDLLMVATDGVYFRTRHPDLDLDPTGLGKWDEGTKNNLTLFMPGIYWDDTSRAKVREGKAPELKSRGISAADLAACIEEIDRQFADMRMGDEWPQIELPVRFNMVTATQALARKKWHTAGVVTTEGVKRLSSNPKTKRVAEIFPAPDKDCIMTVPYTQGELLESTPYDKRFGDEMTLLIDEDTVTTPDGTLALILPGMLNG